MTRNISVCTGDGKHAKRLERAADKTPARRRTCRALRGKCATRFGRDKPSCPRQVRMAVQVKGQTSC